MRNILPIGEPTAKQGHIAVDGTEYIFIPDTIFFIQLNLRREGG